ncbi:MAG: hypothetical protein KDA22_12015 [Phycisphaerales bacterium]|nr:hypothetical protein [Phycisphaerales bacterium]
MSPTTTLRPAATVLPAFASACVLCAATTSTAMAGFEGWHATSHLIIDDAAERAVIDLYARFGSPDDQALMITGATAWCSEGFFLHTDEIDGSWAPQSDGSGDADTYVTLGGEPGPDNATGWPDGSEPPSPYFLSNESWNDLSIGGVQGMPQQIDGLWLVHVGHFVTNAKCSNAPGGGFDGEVVRLHWSAAMQAINGDGSPSIAVLMPAVIDFPMIDCGAPADLDGDGNIGAADLGLLLSLWGPCDDDCPADLNGDGLVDGADLANLLAAWNDAQ